MKSCSQSPTGFHLIDGPRQLQHTHTERDTQLSEKTHAGQENIRPRFRGVPHLELFVGGEAELMQQD